MFAVVTVRAVLSASKLAKGFRITEIVYELENIICHGYEQGENEISSITACNVRNEKCENIVKIQVYGM
jgi:hypothetical protein